MLGFVMFASFSCADDVLDKQPTDRVSSTNFWTNSDDVNAGVISVYDALSVNLRDLGWESLGFFDLLTPLGNCRSDIISDVAGGVHDPASGAPRDLWRYMYRGVVRANDVLMNIGNATFTPDEADLQTRLEGETRYLRAMYYYLLVENFGDVPLIENVPGVEDASISRSPKADVIALIYSDLDFAIDALPVSYASADLGRATKGAALSMKVKVALMDKNWDVAATAASEVMTLGYSLQSNYEDIFAIDNENNSEVIFDVQHVYQNDSEPGSSIEKLYANRSSSANGWTWFHPTTYMVEKFEVIDPNPVYVQEDPKIPTEIYDYFEGRDPRMDWTILRPGAHVLGGNGMDLLYPYDINGYNHSLTGMTMRKRVIPGPGVSANTDGPLNVIIIRYADLLLNYLEATAQVAGGIENVDQGTLDETINAVRARASAQLPLFTAGNITWDDLYDERVRELAMEGWIYFDMKRWGTIEINDGFEVMGLSVTGSTIEFSSTPIQTRIFDPQKHYLFPIPQNERDRATNLTQNPGYPQ